ncbi:glutamine synthetase [Kushneria pakistanensis]|uniref:Glutamine synthetase n=1 Tax=Kushneria pakistanensis TaxID=1508770 RepID=A0ABQ3FP19_9GAMM|nr:glutamine synthetase family protein [Kushneria pakistanensis]GHC32076.1 glutamine synthetase [Kushneria pakistanensis]
MNDSPAIGVIEARHFLETHPEVTQIDVLISDLNGVLRGKRIPRTSLDEAYTSGVNLPASIFALDITGNTVEETGLGLDSGDGDRACLPIPGTLVPVSWHQRAPTAQLLMTMVEPDGSGWHADPRQVLARVLGGFTRQGLTPVVAIEQEFYLLDAERNDRGQPQPPRSPLTGERARSSQLYSISELDEYADFIDAIHEACAQQGLPLDTALKECAPGQFEINLRHRSDALRACDDAVMLKRAIKGVAQQQGFEATFMAKPWGNEAGSGTHVHISLLDEHGRNVFAAEDKHPMGSALLHQAIAGVLDLMPASMAVCAPNLNAFRRFQPGLYVPMAPSWGLDNRSVAVRIPSGPAAATRLEHRVAGADVNVYLLCAVLLASIAHGLEERLTPPPAIEGNAYTQLDATLPDSWGVALELWMESEVLGERLGRGFQHIYYANRQAERALALRTVSALEYDWYLRLV